MHGNNVYHTFFDSKNKNSMKKPNFVLILHFDTFECLVNWDACSTMRGIEVIDSPFTVSVQCYRWVCIAIARVVSNNFHKLTWNIPTNFAAKWAMLKHGIWFWIVEFMGYKWTAILSSILGYFKCSYKHERTFSTTLPIIRRFSSNEANVEVLWSVL